ncbi:MAG: TIM barrel protein [Planctomycetes bacterium]|nr:TIM barrel protein [Planctomycetota bacterium]
MERREFIQHLGLGASALGFGAARSAHSAHGAHSAQEPSPVPPTRSERFTLCYAPHFGMFRHHAGENLLDQLRFMRDEGFRALEDNGMPGRDAATQAQIGDELERLGMTMGVFVAHADFSNPSFATADPAARERIAKDMRNAVEIAKRCRARWCTVVPGTLSPRVEPEYQLAWVIDNLRFAAEILEPAGLTMVLEPLNHWSDHAGVFLARVPQAFAICRAVNSPACKILDDLYHQQITEGHLIRNLDRAWSEIAYIQVGDNPGRKEPGTGEIHYGNVFRHLKAKGYTGVVGMEHGNAKPGKEGERALIKAYAAVDPKG